MKSIFLLSAILFLSIISQGQRVCDLEAHILLPDSGNQFYAPGPNTVNMAIVNMGPDLLKEGDWIGVGLWVQGHHLGLQTMEISDNTYEGDTIRLTNDAKFLYKVDAYEINLCINRCFAWTAYGSNDTVVIERDGQENYKNNTDCVNGDVTYTLGEKKVSKDFDQVLFYPNPTSDVINFNGDYKEKKYFIYNSIGKTVLTGFIDEFNQINVENIESGVYFVVVESKGFTLQNKLIKE